MPTDYQLKSYLETVAKVGQVGIGDYYLSF